MTARPSLGDLELLLAVARAGSIGRAAEEHGLTQPSLSRRMAALERSLGVPLLARSRRGSALTPSGQVVLDWAATLLAASDTFEQSVRTLRDTRAVAVRAAVSMTIAEHHAPRWLAALHARGSGVTVSLEVHNSADVLDLVEAGRCDLGFVETPTVRTTVRRRRVGWDRLVVAVPPGHAWVRRRRPVTPAELAGAGLLVREPGSGTRQTLERALGRHGLALAGDVVMGSNAALKAAAVAGLGPVVVSERALENELATGLLVEVEVPDLALRRPLTAVWRRDDRLADRATELLTVAVEAAASGR